MVRVALCVYYDGVGCEGGGLFLILGGNFFARLLYCMYMVVLNATHLGTHTLMPSCRVAVRLVLLVVAGTTSQRFHSLMEVTQVGWCVSANITSASGI